MRQTLAALTASSAVGLVAWVVTELLAARATGVQGLDRWNVLALATPLTLGVLLIAPMIAGATAGVVSGTATAALGSIVGYLGVMLAASTLNGDPIQSTGAYVFPSVVLVVLILAGHMTGLAVRPKLRSA